MFSTLRRYIIDKKIVKKTVITTYISGYIIGLIRTRDQLKREASIGYYFDTYPFDQIFHFIGMTFWPIIPVAILTYKTVNKTVDFIDSF